MTGAGTIARVARPRGEVTPEQATRLERARMSAEVAQHIYRSEVVAVLTEGASFAEVSKATGLSKTTLQKWKREAGRA